VVRLGSRTSSTWPGCVASCVRVFDPFLVDIDAAWHLAPLNLIYSPCF
jgi:hypothetical protein